MRPFGGWWGPPGLSCLMDLSERDPHYEPKIRTHLKSSHVQRAFIALARNLTCRDEAESTIQMTPSHSFAAFENVDLYPFFTMRAVPPPISGHLLSIRDEKYASTSC